MLPGMLWIMNKPVVWICGGVDKGNDYEELFSLVEDKVKAIICLGKDNSKLIEAFGGLISHRGGSEYGGCSRRSL